MRYVSFYHSGKPRLGVLEGDLVLPLEDIGFSGHMNELLDLGPDGWLEIKNKVSKRTNGRRLPVKSLIPAPIVPNPVRSVFSAGKNYADHAAEYAKSGYDKADAPDIPEEPVTFFKLAECVIGSGEPVEAQPDATREMDYEAELAAVLWRGGRSLSHEDAAGCVFGFFLVNDLTARDWQKGHDQWVVGKSFDGYLPVGSVLVTADEVQDMSDLRFECFVNGELRQKGDPSQLIFDIPALVSYISKGITMRRGDILTTGSPLGPGIGFNPPKFLKPGDEVRITSDLLGELITPVI
jgi:2-keto-4-pentenoate hydratase/2-oxohepta-3-ene-1,7-dioic acid hydratase in catechol pathway